MTTNEKMLFLESLENSENFSAQQLQYLKRFSYDPNAMVRARVAAILVGVGGMFGQTILIRLTNDKKAFVRVEAYDSLCAYPTVEVQAILYEAILHEIDSLARNYAILSWVDVSLVLPGFDECHLKYCEIVQRLKNNEQDSSCKVAYCYALAKFGDLTALNELMRYLEHPDYRIRCSVLSCLREVQCDNQWPQIYKILLEKLESDCSRAVRCAIMKLLEKRDDS